MATELIFLENGTVPPGTTGGDLMMTDEVITNMFGSHEGAGMRAYVAKRRDPFETDRNLFEVLAGSANEVRSHAFPEYDDTSFGWPEYEDEETDELFEKSWYPHDPILEFDLEMEYLDDLNEAYAQDDYSLEEDTFLGPDYDDHEIVMSLTGRMEMAMGHPDDLFCLRTRRHYRSWKSRRRTQYREVWGTNAVPNLPVVHIDVVELYEVKQVLNPTRDVREDYAWQTLNEIAAAAYHARFTDRAISRRKATIAAKKSLEDYGSEVRHGWTENDIPDLEYWLADRRGELVPDEFDVWYCFNQLDPLAPLQESFARP